MPKRFSCIIGTYNQLTSLPKTLKALGEQTYKDFDVHLCSDGSDDPQTEEKLLHQLLPEIPVYYYHQPRGESMRLAKSLNQGLLKADGEYCVVLMGDSFPQDNYLERLKFHARPNALISSFRINLNDVPDIVSYDWRFGNKPPSDFKHVIYASGVHPWTDMTGNGMVMPTAFVKEIGGWCEEYEGYGRDDWDVTLQAKTRGFDLFTVPSAILFHFDHPSQPDNPKSIEIFERRLKEVV